jgi:hypothetical protein
MKTTITHALAWAVTAFLAGAALVISFFIFGDQLEAELKPLFKDVKGVFVLSDSAHIELLVTGVKARNCQLTAVNATVLTNHGWVPAVVTLMKQDGSKLTLEEQRIATGTPFVRLANIVPGGTAVRLVVEGRCHSLWLSHQHLPTFSISPNNSPVAQR